MKPQRQTWSGVSMVVLLPLSVAAEVPEYQIVDIGTLGGNHTVAADLNNAGQVTGQSTLGNGRFHAFLYSDGEMVDLGTLGGQSGRSEGIALNEAGQVTGESVNEEGRVHAFLYADGMMLDLGTLGGVFSEPSDINNAGEVTGVSTIEDGEFHPFLYSKGEMSDLGNLGDGRSSGIAINDAGQVVGRYTSLFESYTFLYSGGTMIDLLPSISSNVEPFAHPINSAGHVTGTYRPSGTNRAFLYRHGGAIDLGTLGGNSSGGVAINDEDQVTGSASTSDGDSHAFLYSDGMMQDLGTLGGDSSRGSAINSAGDVAGASITLARQLSEPFVYTDGRMIELDIDPLGGIEGSARDINDAGQVLAVYEILGDPNSEDPTYARAFIATPVALLFSKLIAKTIGVGPGKSLQKKAEAAEAYYGDSNLGATCRALGSFVREVKAQSGKKNLPRDKGDELRADARSIEQALGC